MNFTWLYVGVLYAAAIALARRARVDIPRRVALFFYALVLIFFWLPLTQGFVNFQVDVLPSIPPWSHMTGYHYQYTSELNDLPMQIVPWMHQVREAWKSLDAPLWNQFSGSGYPLLGNGQSEAFALLRLLTLPLPLGRAVTAEAALKVLIALTFTFIYCRRRYGLLASTIAAVTFGFCGFIIGWLHFPLVTAACLSPAVLLAVDLLVERRTFGRFVFAAVLWAELLFAGHPETAAHLFWLSLMYVLWLLFAERLGGTTWKQRGRLFVTLGGALAVAALLAAPYLGPLGETMIKSKRKAELDAAPLQAGALPNIDRNSAIVMLLPHFFGQIPLEHPWGPADTEPVAGYAGVFGIVAWIATAASVVQRRAWRSREMFFVLATLFVIGVIYGWPGISQAFHAMMPIAANARMRLIFVLLVSIQAAAAVDRARRIPLLVGVLGVSALFLLIFKTSYLPAPYRFDTAVLAMLPGMGVLIAAIIAALSERRAAVILLLVAVIGELFAIERNRPTPLPDRMLYPTTPAIRQLQAFAAKTPATAPFRFAGIGPQFFPNTSAMYGLEDIRAHDPMSNARYLAFLKLTANYEPWNYFAFLPSPDKSVFDFLNVRYLMLDPGFVVRDSQRFPIVYDGPDGRIVENRDVLPRFFAVRNVLLEYRDEAFYPMLRDHHDWANTALLDRLKLETEQQRLDFFNPRPANAPVAHASIVKAKPTDYRLRVDAPRWSLVVSSVPWWPGWKVVRDGKRIEPTRVNGVFLGFAVPPGTSDVRVYYSPASYWVGVWISIATMIALGVFGWRRRGLRDSARA